MFDLDPGASRLGIISSSSDSIASVVVRRMFADTSNIQRLILHSIEGDSIQYTPFGFLIKILVDDHQHSLQKNQEVNTINNTSKTTAKASTQSTKTFN